MNGTINPESARSDSISKAGLPMAGSGWSPSAFSEHGLSEKAGSSHSKTRGSSAPMRDWGRSNSERFTEIDEIGQVKSIGFVTKIELCELYGLKLRDLREFDSNVGQPSIRPLGSLLIFKVFNLRAFLKADSVMVFDDLPVSGAVSLDGTAGLKFLDRPRLMHNLATIDQFTDNSSVDFNPEYGMVYEFRVLACLLDAVCFSLSAEYAHLKTAVVRILEVLDVKTDCHSRKVLLIHGKQTFSFIQRIASVQNCLKEILDSDFKLESSYLSYHSQGSQELEILLESFLRFLEDLVADAQLSLKHIRTTEEIIELTTNSMHNTLIALDLRVALLSCGVGGAALVAGVFGMNLKTDIEEAPFAFFIVLTLSTFAATSGVVYGWTVLEKAIKGSSSNLPCYPLGGSTVVAIKRD